MDSSLTPPTGTVVAVTGAGTGIGRATARAFAARGAHVLAVGRRTEPLEETAAGHGRITPLAADITADGGPEPVVRTALRRATGGQAGPGEASRASALSRSMSSAVG